MITALLVAAALAAAGFGLLRAARSLPAGLDLSSLARWGTIERKLAVRSFIVREETVLAAPASGTVRIIASHGERVRPEQVLVELVDLAERRETEAQLAELDRRIRALEAEARGSRDTLTSEDAAAAVNHQAALAALGQVVMSRQTTGFVEAWEQVAAAGRARATTASRLADIRHRAEALERQREQLVMDLREPGTALTSQLQGLVSYVFDGHEGTRASQLMEMEPARFLGLRESKRVVGNGLRAVAGDAVCQLIGPSRAHLVSLLTATDAARLAQGDRLVVRFPGTGEAVLKAQVVKLGAPHASGTVMVQIETDGLVHGLLSGRWIDCELLLTSRSGVIIPRNTLTSRDGQAGVLVLSRASAYFRPVTVLDSAGGDVLVQGITAGTALARYPWLWTLLGKTKATGALPGAPGGLA